MPVIPLWICAVVGAGVANLVPGEVRVALAGTSAAGVEPRWQLSQVVPLGTCEFAPAGDVAGITMILVMPVKLAPVIAGPWQVAQPVVMPAWLIAEFVNLAPFGTGVAAMLEPAPTWQVSQEAVVGTWPVGSPTIEKPAAGIANEAAALPWHCVQLVVVLGAFAWMSASDGITEKSGLLWQLEHCELAAVGMWFAGFVSPAKNAVPVWHCEQSPVVGCAPSAIVNGDVAVLPGRVWKPRYWVADEPDSAAGEMG